MSVRTVYLHGRFKDLYPEGIRIDAETVAEVVTAVSRRVKALWPRPGSPRNVFRVVGHDTVDSLQARTDATEIHLVPAFAGGKGFFKILLGVVLIAASFFVPPGGLVLFGGALTISASSVFFAGLTMLVGGILELLSPAPQRDAGPSPSTEDPAPSKYLGAPKNTVAVGTRIIVGYGRHQVYGHYISFDLRAVDQAGTPAIAGVPTWSAGISGS